MLTDQFALNNRLKPGKNRETAQSKTIETVCNQIQTIETSQGFILLLIGAIILSYYTTSIQKKELQCALGCLQNCSCPDTFIYRVISAIAILIATGYFYILSEQQVCVPQQNCIQMQIAQNSQVSSLLVLLAAAVRLFNLFFSRFAGL